jgi:MFS transporter, NNP family, nitrate/nitrite transporter
MSGWSESGSLISVKWKKYQTYAVVVDATQDDRSKEIQLLSLQRPHMRAFHLCWISFFMAYIVWFSITPLLPEIRKTLDLSKKEIWTSSIAGVGGTIAVRFLLGPLCDIYGARTLFAMVLCMASIPTAMTGLVRSATDLAVLRFFMGIAGGSFVMTEYWTR